MSEIFLPLIAVLGLYVIMQLIRARFRDRVSNKVKITVYAAAIVYFGYIAIFNHRPEQSGQTRVLLIIIVVGLICYYVYKIIGLAKGPAKP